MNRVNNPETVTAPRKNPPPIAFSLRRHSSRPLSGRCCAGHSSPPRPRCQRSLVQRIEQAFVRELVNLLLDFSKTYSLIGSPDCRSRVPGWRTARRRRVKLNGTSGARSAHSVSTTRKTDRERRFVLNGLSRKRPVPRIA